MKTSIQVALSSLSLLLSLLILSSCGAQTYPELKLVINTSFSASTKVQSKEASNTINRLILASHPGPLQVLGVARHPLNLYYTRTTKLNAQKLWSDLTREREEQALNACPDSREGHLPVPEGSRYIFGWGTDHAPALRSIIESRALGRPLLVVLITDGYNEDHPWSETEEALKLLLEGGRIRLFVLGLSQQVIEAKSQLTITEKWKEMLRAAGAEDLTLHPRTNRGFYLSSRPTLPWELFTLPFHREIKEVKPHD